MNRPFLFMAGEYAVTMPLVFSRENWSHTMTSRKLWPHEDFSGTFHRDNVEKERLQGLLWYASVANTEVRRFNLHQIIRHGWPCWPDPQKLLEVDRRQVVLQKCRDAGFLQHPVVFALDTEKHKLTLEYPYVLKVGNLHQGEGKILVQSEGDIPETWEWLATAEPFFDGVSCRVLTIGDKVFTTRYDNPNSWIKNSAGADVEYWPEMPQAVIDHATKVHTYFGLEVSGIDYIVCKDGSFHFLEYNMFPGVGLEGEISETAKTFFSEKMNELEKIAKQNLASNIL